MKTPQTRINDTLRYIRANIAQGGELADHLTQTMGHHATEIGAGLSLETERTIGYSVTAYRTETQRRHALRALLLCQRVYFSDLWARFAGAPRNRLPAQWKSTSLLFWGGKLEHEIRQGIQAFTMTSNDRSTLADAAQQQPGAGITPDLTMTRAKNPFPGDSNSCYGSVITWMFQSGLVSYRWFMRHAPDSSLKDSNSKRESLLEAFGAGHPVWDPNQAFPHGTQFPDVARGMIVHLYSERNFRWVGHWLVSNGNGTGAGCNNDTTDGTVRKFAAACSLSNQFHYGYKNEQNEAGGARRIDPQAIPNRI